MRIFYQGRVISTQRIEAHDVLYFGDYTLILPEKLRMSDQELARLEGMKLEISFILVKE